MKLPLAFQNIDVKCPAGEILEGFRNKKPMIENPRIREKEDPQVLNSSQLPSFNLKEGKN